MCMLCYKSIHHIQVVNNFKFEQDKKGKESYTKFNNIIATKLYNYQLANRVKQTVSVRK
jgi:hypothetical protein